MNKILRVVYIDAWIDDALCSEARVTKISIDALIHKYLIAGMTYEASGQNSPTIKGRVRRSSRDGNSNKSSRYSSCQETAKKADGQTRTTAG